MYSFFLKLYASLLNGTWLGTAAADQGLRKNAQIFFKNLFDFLLNALGGNFQEKVNFDIYQGFDTIEGLSALNANFYCAISAILALITMIGFCFATWKIIKGVLSIFFEGWR